MKTNPNDICTCAYEDLRLVSNYRAEIRHAESCPMRVVEERLRSNRSSLAVEQ